MGDQFSFIPADTPTYVSAWRYTRAEDAKRATQVASDFLRSHQHELSARVSVFTGGLADMQGHIVAIVFLGEEQPEQIMGRLIGIMMEHGGHRMTLDDAVYKQVVLAHAKYLRDQLN